MSDRLRVAWTVLRRSLAEARDDDIGTIARALSYSLFLAIPATMLVVLGVFSLTADASTVDRLLERASAVMPAEAVVLLRDSLRRSVESASTGLLATMVGVALAVWTMTSAATTLMQGLTRAYDRDDERSFVRRRLLALGIVAMLVASAVLVVTLLVLGAHVERWIGAFLGAEGVTAWAWWTLQWPVLVATLLGVFALVLAVAPDVDRAGWRSLVPGAAVAVAVWLVASGAFALYTAHFGSYDRSWGALSAVVVTLVWLWLTSAALLFGAEVNAEARRLSEESRPDGTPS